MRWRTLVLTHCGWVMLTSLLPAAEDVVDYEKDVAPLMRKYCAGCHNDKDLEGDFSLESFASLQKGIKDKPAVLPGDPEGSRLWRVVSKQDEPSMPPEGEKAPTAKELATLKAWIEQGARGPAGMEPDRLTLHVPKIPTQTDLAPITALAFGPQGDTLAVARYEKVEILQREKSGENDSAIPSFKPLRELSGLPGKVESIHFCNGGRHLITASGVTGSGGLATLWDWSTGERIREFKGHRDILFDAEVSPDGKTLATCSYDRDIILWNIETGEPLRTLSGHTGAVYDVAFNADGTVLASASADDTCKVWRVRDGERLDTLGQPLKEQYSVAFSPDDKTIVASGADNRIRVWKFVSRQKPAINPLLIARFAHEAPIVGMVFTPDGSKLVTTAEDRTLKVWETKSYTELLLQDEPEVAMALAVPAGGNLFTVGRLNGTWETQLMPRKKATKTGEPSQLAAVSPVVPPALKPQEMTEQEPNDQPSQANVLAVPGNVRGVISGGKDRPDHDCFRFAAQAGQEWVIEVDAARSKSELDSFVEVLDVQGQPIERVVLQAVRDSYFTFRGKTGSQADDFRIFNWEEMVVNDLLYCNGEVVKLWKAPRGPDSGFLVYPGSGERWGYFDTTGTSHALGEPCYIVQPHPPGTELIPNGLPVFRQFYENDDSPRRDTGKDSKLFFVAPRDGDYIVRIRDVRGAQGPKYAYTLSVRPAAPDFAVTLKKRKLALDRGSGTEIEFIVTRKDQFDGPITMQVADLPPGLSMRAPLTIQQEQIEAAGVLMASADAPQPTPEQLKSIKFTATATIRGQEVTHEIPGIEELKLGEKPPFTLAIVAAEGGARPVNLDPQGPLEFVIPPGETIMLKVVALRNDFKEAISLGKEDSGRNLPHGVYVDNIGLNGLLMLEDQSEREFYITALDWVPEQTRMFHLRSEGGKAQATAPVILHVGRADAALAQP